MQFRDSFLPSVLVVDNIVAKKVLETLRHHLSDHAFFLWCITEGEVKYTAHGMRVFLAEKYIR